MKPVLLIHRWTAMKTFFDEHLNPHPVFPLWSPCDVYPYQYGGSMRKYEFRQKYCILFLRLLKEALVDRAKNAYHLLKPR